MQTFLSQKKIYWCKKSQITIFTFFLDIWARKCFKKNKSLFFPMISDSLECFLWIKGSPEEMSIGHETSALANVVVLFHHSVIFRFNRWKIRMTPNLTIQFIQGLLEIRNIHLVGSISKCLQINTNWKRTQTKKENVFSFFHFPPKKLELGKVMTVFWLAMNHFLE